MMKKIWMTSMVGSEETIKKLVGQLKMFGLQAEGHFWEDNLEKMAWTHAREELIKPDIFLWLILAPEEKLAVPSLRYGLSLLATTVQAKRGFSFPIAVLLAQGKEPSPETLPTPLKGASFIYLSDPSFGAKLVAKVHTEMKGIPSDYRLDVYGNAQIGQWFEVGPQDATWPGAMFGVVGGEIEFHGVGPKGILPSHSVLNYPLKGLKLSLREKEYIAWAVQNELDLRTSYFVKVKGFPESIMFGPYSTKEEAEVYIVKTK